MQTTPRTPEEFTTALDLFLKAAQAKVDEGFASYATQAGKLSTEEDDGDTTCLGCGQDVELKGA